MHRDLSGWRVLNILPSHSQDALALPPGFAPSGHMCFPVSPLGTDHHSPLLSNLEQPWNVIVVIEVVVEDCDIDVNDVLETDVGDETIGSGTFVHK